MSPSHPNASRTGMPVRAAVTIYFLHVGSRLNSHPFRCHQISETISVETSATVTTDLGIRLTEMRVENAARVTHLTQMTPCTTS